MNFTYITALEVDMLYACAKIKITKELRNIMKELNYTLVRPQIEYASSVCINYRKANNECHQICQAQLWISNKDLSKVNWRSADTNLN